jgi:Ser/Thr protein kinase RdoA (MazF antagonist)
VSPLGDVIAARVAAWGGVDLPLERLAFGTTDPDAVARAIDAWCGAHLDSRIVRYHFFDSSSGSVHGVALADGRDVVVKVHRPGLTREFLTAVAEIQAAFVTHGVPAPQPLAGPAPYGPVHVTAETLLHPGPRADGHDASVRGALARGLARFVAVGRDLEVARGRLAHPMAMPANDLYPPPHSARFDFAATRAGAEWIDDLARRARAALDLPTLTPPVLVHGDWRIENVHVVDGAVAAIYDWDSVCVEPEVFAVATAAVTFPVDWSAPAGARFPSNPEIRAFLAEYEDARGESFDEAARAVMAVRMVYLLAYGARCEHADRYPPIDDSQQGLLARLGDALLTRGLMALD